MARLWTAFFLALIWPNLALAHDFWLAPKTYEIAKPGPVPVSVMVGHPKDQNHWPVEPHRMISVRSVSKSGTQDQQMTVASYSALKALPIKLETKGLHIIALETTSAKSVLEAEKFNNYVEEEGITPILQARTLNGTLDTSGREIYSRRGKALVQVGTPDRKTSKFVSRPLGQTLEIVPLMNPYALKSGEDFTTKVYYRGVPTPGVSVGLVSLDTEAGHISTAVSDFQGNVTIKRPETGAWMLHAVWSDPMENTDDADFDTIFSSLSFGF